MKNKILEIIDRRIDENPEYISEKRDELEELRSEIEKMEEWISENDRLPEKA